MQGIGKIKRISARLPECMAAWALTWLFALRKRRQNIPPKSWRALALNDALFAADGICQWIIAHFVITALTMKIKDGEITAMRWQMHTPPQTGRYRRRR